MKYWRQPLDKQRFKVPRGIVHLIPERCKGCGFCIEFCPKKVLLMSRRTNAKGYYLPEITDDSHCLNCGICMLLCPDFAIYVEEGGDPSATAAQAPSTPETAHTGRAPAGSTLRDNPPKRQPSPAGASEDSPRPPRSHDRNPLQKRVKK